jgi:DNA polymerase I-like protein with 3'-5' exonuclease and polymerase domains/uracil-DNA glycosylase
MKGGFFTRQDLKDAIVKPKRELPTSTIEAMGHRAVAHLNPKAATPNMPHVGCESGPCDIYVLGSHPSPTEDAKGEPWCHELGRPYKSALRGARVRWGHVCRTATKGDELPEPVQLAAYMPALVKEINQYKPKVIVACGSFAFEAFQPGLASNLKGDVTLHRGRAFPVRVGAHECWLWVTADAEQRAKWIEKGNKSCSDGKEWQRFLDEDLKRIPRLVKQELPVMPPHDADAILKSIKTTLCLTEDQAVNELQNFWESLGPKDLVAFDYETVGVRPYETGALVRSFALRSESWVIAVPLDFVGFKKSATSREDILDILYVILKDRPVIVHGLEFECEWTTFLFGTHGARLSKWHCTLMQEYVLGARVSGTQSRESEGRVSGLSLDYVCRCYLGLPLKSLTGLDAGDQNVTLGDLLKYNALDAFAAYEVWIEQQDLISQRKLSSVYREQVDTVPAVVLSQWEGLPVSQEKRIELSSRYNSEIEEIVEKLYGEDEVKEYQKKYGKFNPGNDEHILALFDKVLGIKLTNTRAEVLAEYKDTSYVAKYVVDLRKKQKLLSTYVLPYDPKHEKSILWPDGLVHCKINTARTATSRTSAEAPNVQNWPKRDEEAKEVREVIQAPPGFVFLAFDYAQIEARVLGMAARDKVFCNMLWEEYDVHEAWAIKWKSLIGSKLDIKKLRSIIKNKLVFPWFFGAGVESVARNMGADVDLVEVLREEFKDTFHESFLWQKRLVSAYEKDGYVSTLQGQRRYGPMTYNMKINMPIQGTASRIVLNAYKRVSREAYEKKKPYLAPRLVIHDDLTSLVPESSVDEAVEFTGRRMVHTPYDFVNVPLEVECEIGSNLGEMKKLAKIHSEKKDIQWTKA